MKMKFLTTLALACASAGAHANIYTFTFSTTIASVEECSYINVCHDVSLTLSAGESIEVGQTMFGTVAYNTNTPVSDVSGGGASTTYAAFGAGTGNSTIFGFSNSTLGFTGTESDAAYTFNVYESEWPSSATLYLGTGRTQPGFHQSVNLEFRDTDGTALSGGRLPAGIDLAQYESARVRYDYDPGIPGIYYRVSGNLTDLQSVPTVPEPAGYALLACGLGLLAVRRARR